MPAIRSKLMLRLTTVAVGKSVEMQAVILAGGLDAGLRKYSHASLHPPATGRDDRVQPISFLQIDSSALLSCLLWSCGFGSC